MVIVMIVLIASLLTVSYSRYLRSVEWPSSEKANAHMGKLDHDLKIFSAILLTGDYSTLPETVSENKNNGTMKNIFDIGETAKQKSFRTLLIASSFVITYTFIRLMRFVEFF